PRPEPDPGNLRQRRADGDGGQDAGGAAPPDRDPRVSAHAERPGRRRRPAVYPVELTGVGGHVERLVEGHQRPARRTGSTTATTNGARRTRRSPSWSTAT